MRWAVVCTGEVGGCLYRLGGWLFVQVRWADVCTGEVGGCLYR